MWKGGMQKWKLGREYVRIAYTFLHVLPPDSHAQSVLSNEISAPELRRKSIKSELLVGKNYKLSWTEKKKNN